LRDDVRPPVSESEPGATPRGRVRRLPGPLAAIPWASLLSGRWWWRHINRGLIQSGRLTAILALFGLLALRLEDPQILQLIRARVFDFYQQTQPRTLTEQSPVAIVDIDERSLAALGTFPWPRTIHAQLLNRLAELEAAVVGFDIHFPEADTTSVARLADAIPAEVIDPGTRARLKEVPTNDAMLAEAIKANGRVVLGQVVVSNRVDYKGEKSLTSFAVVGDDPKPFLERHPSVLRPLPVLNSAAAGRGVFSLSGKFFDGIVRQVPLVFAADDQLYPALALEMMRVRLGGRTIGLAADAVRGGVTQVFIRPPRSTERYSIKTDANAGVWVYFRPHATFEKEYVSAIDLLQGEVDKSRIAGKFVLIGTSAIGLLDLRSTPLDATLPGVEVHANIIENVVFQSQLTRPPEATLSEWATAAVVGLVMIVLTPMVGARVGAVLFLAILATCVGYSWNAFTVRLELYDPVFPVFVALLFYMFLTYSGYLRTETSRKQVRQAFGQYLSPALVERLADDPSKLTLGGENRDMTFMFSDIRGFSGISELFDAQGLTRLINRLLTPLTDAILKTNGTIDKYMGDCVMAFWNAPLEVKDHAAEACRAALAMIGEVAKVNAEIEAEAKAEGREHRVLAIGIGINSGIACVGNMGSEQRFDYSVLGDNVNLASRLEGQSKTYHVTIVLGEATAVMASGFATLEIDLIKVKGKSQAARIFTLVGDETVGSAPWFATLRGHHAALLAAYRAQNWDAADRHIAACRDTIAGQTGLPAELNGLYDLYAERIAAFRAEPPPAGWDGVYVAESK
jgi:adenylate cyclase